VAPEPEGSSPYLQEPATGPYPEATEPTLHSPDNLLKFHSDPICVLVFQVILSFWLFHQNLLATRPTPMLEGYPLSAVRDCLLLMIFLLTKSM
jgi:hypothetical protein